MICSMNSKHGLLMLEIIIINSKLSMGEKPNLCHDRVHYSGASLSPSPSTQGLSKGGMGDSMSEHEDSPNPPVLSTAQPHLCTKPNFGSDAGDYLTQTSSFLQSRTSTDKTQLDLLMKREEQDKAEHDAHLALEMRWEEREMRWEEWELRREEREL